MTRAALLALVLLTGCSALPEPYPIIICHATKEPIQCPPEEDAGIRAALVFSSRVMYLADDEALEIHWYDWDELFDDSGDVSGWTDVNAWPHRVHVRNTGVMMHELAHVALKRTTGNADANHETPPGAWGPALNLAIEVATDEYGTVPYDRAEGAPDVP